MGIVKERMESLSGGIGTIGGGIMVDLSGNGLLPWQPLGGGALLGAPDGSLWTLMPCSYCPSD